MEIQQIMHIMDASHNTRRIIERSLREIDRRALNAMVLVKRHGNKLASYGVVAQAFREQAVLLKHAAEPLQQSIAPLVRVHMRMLQQGQFTEMFRRAAEGMQGNQAAKEFLRSSEGNWNHSTASGEAEGNAILRKLVETVTRLQEGIAEQEYVVTNGRIEAALSEHTGAPLMRVSHEMGRAVAKVRDAIWGYRGELEEVLHESRASI
jgi:BMFP domain-containing protein YqiC